MAVPTQVGHYRILEPLGAGAMGDVYRAVDTKMFDRTVAVKVLPERYGKSRQAQERFEREIRVAANLQHTNVVTIHDHGSFDGRMFYVMEFVDGAGLLDATRGAHSRGPREKLEIAVQICDGLQYIHRAGVVHRDLKPANIMVVRQGNRDQVKLLDFGIVQTTESDLTKDEVQPGTSTYMSPEQARGEAIDHRSDLFSLGIVLYELFGGRHPFAAASESLVTMGILQQAPPALDQLRPDLPAELSSIVMQALEKEPARRPGEAGEIERALVALRDRMPTGPPSDGLTPPPPTHPPSWTDPAARSSSSPDFMDAAATTLPDDELSVPPNDLAEAPVEPERQGGGLPRLAILVLIVIVVVGGLALVSQWPALRDRFAGGNGEVPADVGTSAGATSGETGAGTGASDEPDVEVIDPPAAVRAVIESWRAAYAARDVEGILAVYPGLTDVEGMRQSFAVMRWLRLEGSEQTLRVNGDEATAEYRVVMEFLNAGESDPATVAVVSSFRLTQDPAGAWTIVHQDFVVAD